MVYASLCKTAFMAANQFQIGQVVRVRNEAKETHKHAGNEGHSINDKKHKLSSSSQSGGATHTAVV